MENEVKVENEVKEENKKGNGGLILVLVLIIVTLLGVIGYLAISKDVFGFKLSKDTSGNTNTVVNNKSKADSVIAMSSEEKYKAYIENLANQIKSKFDQKDKNEQISKIDVSAMYQAYSSDPKKDVHGIFYINDKLELRYEGSSEDSTVNMKEKVSDDVVYMSFMNEGQGSGMALYFIKTDGKVYRIQTRFASKNSGGGQYFDFENKTMMNVKNIVNIIPASFCGKECSGWGGPLFVDIDGNIYGASIQKALEY